MSVSIKDVAARAGVSTATVSHVLNETRKIRPATRKKVLSAVEELGYSINRAARNLAMGRSSLLGLIISDIRNPFFPEVTAAFQDQALLHQMEALVLNTNYDPHRMADGVRRLIGLQVAGVAVLSSQIDPGVLEMLGGRGVPAVYLDIGPVGRAVSNIAIDYEHGIAEGLEHLRKLGHKEIAYIGGAVHLISAQRRKRAFIECANQMGLEPVAAVDAEFSVKGGYFATPKVLKTFRPTAIVAGNDLIAIGALHCAYDMGLRVPADLSVVGFDDIVFAEYAQPALTTVALPREEIGRVAFQALHRMMASPDQSGTEFRLPTRLVERQSTGPAPSREP